MAQSESAKYSAKKYRDTDSYRKYGAKYGRARRNRIDALKDHPCLDCGGRFPPEAMDFDHIGVDKIRSISNMGSYSMARVEQEIAKCELICANCHRVRTRRRQDEAGSQ